MGSNIEVNFNITEKNTKEKHNGNIIVKMHVTIHALIHDTIVTPKLISKLIK